MAAERQKNPGNMEGVESRIARKTIFLVGYFKLFQNVYIVSGSDLSLNLNFYFCW